MRDKTTATETFSAQRQRETVKETTPRLRTSSLHINSVTVVDNARHSVSDGWMLPQNLQRSNTPQTVDKTCAEIVEQALDGFVSPQKCDYYGSINT